MNTPAGALKRQNRTTHACEVCSALFERRPCETARYCSKACWARRNPPERKDCPQCGCSFVKADRAAKFCSRRCARKSRVGPLANAWKGGKTLERERAQHSQELKDWREAVYRRDNWACVTCGAVGKIHAHHVMPWADHPDLRFEVSNGQTLCEVCHGKVHGVDFSVRRNRKCQDCGKVTKGRGERCRSCSIRVWHASRHTPPSTLPPPLV